MTSSRHWNAGGHALNIETAAYALLAQVKMNRLKYAGPIVIWLTEQKNSGGGFQSTTVSISHVNQNYLNNVDGKAGVEI